MKTEVIYIYENRTDVTLTTYVLGDSPEMLNGAHRPAVIICPGGAYLNLCDREAEPIAMQFAAMGYHAFVLRYSNYTEGENGLYLLDLSVPLEPKGHSRHPAPMRDIAAAMMIIRAHAAEWLVDTDRIALCGFSAGAHNCAMYATNWHKPVISEFFAKNPEEFRPAAAILCYTLSDYIYMAENPFDGPVSTALFTGSNSAFLGTHNADDKLLNDVSPARNVSEYTPPTFLWATSEDALVPVQHTILMAKALADKKIPFEVHIFESGPHGLADATQASAMSKSTIDRDVAQWIPLCNEWLLKRFSLELPALSPWEIMSKSKNEV